eukprot:GSChrysophyteH2.ASY1.ANO1.1163.1 assembled CDS
MVQLGRVRRELEMLATEPGPGISAWPIDDSDMMNLEAQIQGPEDSPYAEGTYTLNLQIPERYPLEPPRLRFVTPIYHPNIDSDGRICLDTLKMQPQGSWTPSININTLLLTIRLLMAQPNADDGLVLDITEEFKRDRALWRWKALQHTRKYAVKAKVNNLNSSRDGSASVSAGTSAGGTALPEGLQSQEGSKETSERATAIAGVQSVPAEAAAASREVDLKRAAEEESDSGDSSDGDSYGDSDDSDESDGNGEVISLFANAPAAKRPRKS